MNYFVYPATCADAPFQPLAELRVWPDDAALLYHFDPEREQELHLLAKARIAGQHGPLAIYAPDLPLLTETAPWLRQNFADIQLLTSPEACLNWMQSCKPLSSKAWQIAASAHFLVFNARLKHDLQNALRNWPSQQTHFSELFAQLGAECQALTPLLHSPFEALATLAQDPQTDLEALQTAWQEFWQALIPSQTDPVLLEPVSLAALIAGLQSLQAHWQALIADQVALKQHLQHLAMSPAESTLAKALQGWLQIYPEAELLKAHSLCAAAQTLKQIMAQRDRQTRGGALAQAIHNTLDQHLYTCANLLMRWQQVLSQVVPHVSKSLTLANLQEHIAEVQNMLPQAQAFVRNDCDREDAPCGSERVILLLEDHPVWLKELHKTLQAALSAFLQKFPAQRERQWKIVQARCLAEAEPWIGKTHVLLTDLSLPQNSGETALRENGLNWLRQHLPQIQKRGVQILVHTSPSWFLADQLCLGEWGVQDLDYVLKSQPEDLAERITVALENLRRQEGNRGQYHLEIDQSQLPEQFWLNQVRLDLSEQMRLILLTLAKQKVLTGQELCQAIEGEAQPAEEGGPTDPFSLFCQKLPPEFRSELPSHLRFLQLHWQKWGLAPHYRGLSNHVRWTHFILYIAKKNRFLAIWLEGGKDSLLCQVLQKTQAKEFVYPESLIALLEVPSEAAQTQLTGDSNAKVSKWLYPLKKAIQTAFNKVHQPLDCESLFVSISPEELEHSAYLTHPGQHGQHLYGLSRQVSCEWFKPVESPPALFEILLIENDPIFAQEIQLALEQVCRSQRRGYHLHWATSVEGVESYLQNKLPDLVLLDLHLPLTQSEYLADPLSGQNESGYRALQLVRLAFKLRAPQKHYRVLVTSSLSDDDDLRRQGLSHEIPLRNFIPKGQTFQGQDWPDSLLLKLHRILQELAQNQYLPDSEDPQDLHLPCPMAIRVLAVGDKRLKLEVSADTPQGRDTRTVEHKGKNSAFLRLLLKDWPAKVSEQELAEIMGDAPPFHLLKNARNRLRKAEINLQWPVAWMGQDNPGIDILKQKLIAGTTWYWLNVSEVQDPEGQL
jgi:DNA-binding response OmpR family regulator